MKISSLSPLLLVLVIACHRVDADERPFSGRSESKNTPADRQGRPAETTSDDAILQESVQPPANIAGSYLIGCALTDTQQVNKNPSQVSFGCGIVNKEGGSVSSEGQWNAALMSPKAGETLQIGDAKLGKFQLTAVTPEQLVPAMSRVMISFQGKVEGQDGLLTENGSRTLSIDLTKAQSIIRYSFTVQIASGTRTGKTYTGSFQYDTSKLTGSVQETLPAQILRFDYLRPDQQTFDSAGTLSFANGKFLSLTVAGGPGTERFGINTGFDRNQFGRAEEAFVRNGDQYFGYLAPDSFIDGAGTIRYTLL